MRDSAREAGISTGYVDRALADVGVASTVGRSLSWVSADAQRKVHISVQVRGGRTTIRVGERLAPLRGSIFGGVMAARRAIAIGRCAR